MEYVKNILKGIDACLEYPESPYLVSSYPEDISQYLNFKNQCLIFLKPEITSVHLGVNLSLVLQILFELADQQQILFSSCNILSTQYLSKLKIVEKNYYGLNLISKKK